MKINKIIDKACCQSWTKCTCKPSTLKNSSLFQGCLDKVLKDCVDVFLSSVVISFRKANVIWGLFPPPVQVYSGVSGMAHLEVELQQEGGVSPQDDGGQLQELPFTPVHAPVITLGTSIPR